MKEHMDRFPARLPPDLKKALDLRAKSLRTSMNDLVVLGVRHVVEDADLIVTPSGIGDAHEDLVLAVITENDIAPAKGIARHFAESGQPNLGALLFFFASQMQPDPKEKAKELAKSAWVVQDRSRPIAIALLRVALECNPGSDLVKSRLGQLLNYEGDHVGAVALLESARHADNYAKLAYGWSTLELAGDDPAEIERALDEIVAALKRWALDPSQADKRHTWLNQLGRLKARGPEFEQAISDLVQYANDNASWRPPIAMSEIRSAPSPTTAKAEPEPPRGTEA